MAPSNYTLRFDAGVAMQKFSASTLQKAKRTANELSMTSSKYDRDKNLLVRLHWLRKPGERLNSKENFRWKGENLRKCAISVFKFQP